MPKGPLSDPNEKSVHFVHEGAGVYGDAKYQLPLKGGGKYQLVVTMGDGRRYSATTTIPELFNWEVPDSLKTDVELDRFYTGVYKEENKEPISFPFSVSPDVGYIADKRNSEYDYYNFDVQEGGFLFDNRGSFLREGSGYGLFDATFFPDIRETGLNWLGAANKLLRTSETWYLSLSQMNVPLSTFYYSPYRFIGNEPDGRLYKQDQARLNALVNRDPTFFFSISNILKTGEDSETLSKDQTDAIGVFGGYSAAYRKVTIIAQRSWDPDTLNWGNQDN